MWQSPPLAGLVVNWASMAGAISGKALFSVRVYCHIYTLLPSSPELNPDSTTSKVALYNDAVGLRTRYRYTAIIRNIEDGNQGLTSEAP